MTQLTADEAAHAVRDAQEIFRRELGDEPDTFAYPFGAFNATAVEAVRNAAVLLAFTTKSGTVFNWDGRLTIPRIHVGPGTTTGALLRAMGVLAVR
jgi:peptidoglycan/xylan/chitin deacetylase (PgdA/CDA1 family)